MISASSWFSWSDSVDKFKIVVLIFGLELVDNREVALPKER